ncbi:MAG: protein O-GlcNAc transferase [Alphaproteobacteria bacterium]|jgi:predicted O-linked N-acetylglucosamine transferase (SPINDLY family)|nr:protein O-GlcNAc transferase [Alphaproteobacteria bacterium]
MVDSPKPGRETLEQWFGQAMASHQRGQLDAAEGYYRQILSALPNHPETQHFFGILRFQQGQHQEALDLIGAALRAKPDYPEALYNRGNILLQLERHEEALANYERAATLDPDYAEAHLNRGNILLMLKRHQDAFASYDRALAVRPNYAEAHNGRGNALSELKQYEEAVASYDRALAIEPGNPSPLNNRGNALRALGRLDEALVSYEKAQAANPNDPYIFGAIADCAVSICDWTRTAKLRDELTARVRDGRSVINPFTMVAFGTEPSDQLKSAQHFVASEIPKVPRFENTPPWRNDKIRLAYLSSDFRIHPIAIQMAQLFELHDRSKFEVTAVSFGPDDGSPLRARLVRAFDKFRDVRGKSDRDVAALLHENKTDIVVDLNNYSEMCRPGILAHRPAPIQVAYLGYPTTMGADFMDYVIADPIVLPFDQQRLFTEKIVHLPDTYQVSDSKLKAAERTFTRQEMGLPDDGFVFCCFNNNYKITPPVFDVWMRLLRKVPSSVLWLHAPHDRAKANLRDEAKARGVDPDRLVFAAPLRIEEHVARQRLADLFLDTLPYNAHGTASSALWSGLPMLTCRGDTFAGRVGASLLLALGLEELVTDNLADYEALAMRLATDPAFLADIRRKLEENTKTHPLFDTDRFRRHIEAAYTQMWDIWQRGESPRSFGVEAIN